MDLQYKIKNILEGFPSKVKIGNVYVGYGQPVFVIAEIGINHNGDIDIASKLIEEAAKAGANAVKFQKRTPEEILTKEGLEKPYDSPNAFAPTYGEHRKKLELSEKDYIELMALAEKLGVKFFASVWDEKSADFLRKLNISAFKIPSADIINIPLLEYVAKKDKPVIVSTGMNTEEEIRDAVNAILKYNNRIIIMQCTSLYPLPHDKINLSFMDVLKKEYYPLPFGYSGHEIDFLPSISAVARGAHIIERHFTLNKNMKGSDHSSSLEPNELKALIQNIREVEIILGKKEKIIFDELIPTREKLAKSIVAKKFIPKGATITKEMITVKGPGYGLKPSLIKEILGKEAECDIGEDTLFPKDALNWRK